MALKLNPITGKFDLVSDETSDLTGYIKKDGTTTTTAQIPFAVGLQSSDDVIIKAGKKLIFDGV